MRLEGKVALITGAARGIGKAIAKKFIQEGARVFICDLSAADVERCVAELNHAALGGEISGMAADVSNQDAVNRLIDGAVKQFGRIDILANNAGTCKFTDFLTLSSEDWDKTLAVNLKGQFLVAQATAKVMVSHGKGVIVNMSSTNGLYGEAKLIDYNASKAGVILLSKTMAIELAPFGIRVNSVCPGFILTELALEGGMPQSEIDEYVGKIPLGRCGRPEDVANLFAFLSSDEASFITGSEFVIDGGQTCQE